MAFMGLTTEKGANDQIESAKRLYRDETEKQLRAFGVKDEEQIKKFLANVYDKKEEGPKDGSKPVEKQDSKPEEKPAENGQGENKDEKAKAEGAKAGEAPNPVVPPTQAEQTKAEPTSAIDQKLNDQKATIEGQAAKISALEESLGKVMSLLEKLGVKSEAGKVAVGLTPSPEPQEQTDVQKKYEDLQKKLGKRE